MWKKNLTGSVESGGLVVEERVPSTRGRKWHMHWHVALVHFPTAGFTGAFLFMFLHLVTRNPCLPYAAYITLVASTVVLVPVTVTGWLTWRRNYLARWNTTFTVKIWTSVAMLVVAIALVLYQTAHPFALLDASARLAHAVYFAGVVLLMVGAIAEGFFGGRLHHR